MRIVACFLLSIVLAGCAASGVKVSEQQAQSFKVGTSTYQDVVAALGEPTSNTVSSDGTRVASYNYSAIRSQPQNFIPYLGPLVAGYDNQSSAVNFTFDKRGVLTASSSSQSGMGTGANLAAGSNAATRPYQGVRN
jgi:outer membrane protein assembly factor BamE (lipoprotein component of BamABCDE complex)